MTIATLRPKGQLTIPSQMLRQWNIKPYDQVEISFQNGVITIVPANRNDKSKKCNLKAFAGIGRGCWGKTPESVNDSILNLRDSWSR